MDVLPSADTITETTPLPELSFDDLLDISPAQKNAYSTDEDPLDLEDEKKSEDDTLNTPGPKRPKLAKGNDRIPVSAPVTKVVLMEPKSVAAATSSIPSTVATTTITATTGIGGNMTATTIKTSTPVLLNAKNVLPKTATPAGQVIKIAKPATSTVGTNVPASMVGKTAVKTSNGQIIFIQKTAGLTGVRIQAKSTSATTSATTTTSSLGGAVVSASPSNRSVGGAIVPTTATPGGTSAAGITLKTVMKKALSGSMIRSSPQATAPVNKPVVSGTVTKPTSVTGVVLKQATATAKSASASGGVVKTTASPSVITKTTTTAGNKMIGIQIMRTADGAIVPVKTFTTNAPGTQLTGKKIISASGGQIVIKTPLKSATASASSASSSVEAMKGIKFKLASSTSGGNVSSISPTSPMATMTTSAPTIGNAPAAATSMPASTSSITSTAATSAVTTSVVVGGVSKTSNATAAATATSTSTTTANAPSTSTSATLGGGTSTSGAANNKIIMQGTSGKQMVVSKHGLIKLSPGAAKTSGDTAVSSGAGQLHAIQIPGKQGVQYVRVLPSSKFAAMHASTAASTTPTPSTSASVSTSIAASATSASATYTSTASTSAATSSPAVTSSPSTVKIMNSVPQKFTVVRPSNASKLMLTQSPKKDGNVTFVPVTSKVQKTLVTVPKMRNSTTGEGSDSTLNSQQAIMRSASGPSTGSISIIKKHKISDINKEISKITADDDCQPPAAKKPANGNQIMLMSRAVYRGNSNASFQPRPGTVHRVTVQNSPTTPSISNASRSPVSSPNSKKLYSVLKSNNMENAQTNIKSLIVCGQLQSMSSPEKKSLAWSAENEKKLDAMRRPGPPVPAKVVKNHKSREIITVAVQIKKEGKKTKSPTEVDTGPVRRKHCNCSKSQCLKLYCDCFANGEFCQDCTCKDCFNNLQYEEERQRAIKNCLDRNPSAFKPKITTARDQGDQRLHNKGCNCKRSGCLKNYCECYEAKIPCSSNCKCVGCRNVEDRPDLDMDPDDTKQGILTDTRANKRGYEKISFSDSDRIKRLECDEHDENQMMERNTNFVTTEKPQCNFITAEVIDATIQCMLTQAEECEKNGLLYHQTEKMVLEELGRCLVEIIDFSIRNSDASFTQEN